MRLILTYALLITLRALPAGAFVQPGETPFFVPNHGESPAAVKYFSRTQHMVAQFADREANFVTPSGGVRLAFVGAAQASSVVLAGNILRYRGTWPGIEAQYAPYEQTVKSEYHVAPGADPALIRLHYEGETIPRLRGDGSLVIGLPGSEFVESPPYAYQDHNGRVQIPAAFRIYRDGTVGFRVGPYDTSRPLVIDPVMSYSTFLGGSGNTSITSVAFDVYGNAVVAGWTTATDLPTKGVKPKNAGGVDAFVAKLSMEGNRVVWCTYLGGNGDDRAFGVAVDNSGNVYVTGWTQSTNFPLYGAIQTKLSGGRDAFVTKLNSTGTAILYSTYLGGTNYDQGNAITVDSTGAAYITGDTTSPNFPSINAYQGSYGGQQDAFVAKVNPAGSALVYSTYLGGNAVDHGTAIAIDASLNAYITGATYSANFPVANATQPRIGGGEDAFAAELNSSGNSLIFGTFIGGSGGTPGLEECGNAVAVDISGNLYVAGGTSSIDFPTTAGAYQRTLTNGGAEDHGFAWKINSSKSQITYSTYLAGMNMDLVNGLAVDPAGNAYLVGSTSSTDFPIVRAFQTAITGMTNAFLLKLNSTGSALIFGTYLGGTNSDTANGVAVDSKQNVVVSGVTGSADFPLLNATQSYSNAPLNGFVARVVCNWYPIAFQNGQWYIDPWRDAGYDGSSWNMTSYSFGTTGDKPVVGDWNKSGTTKIGVFRNGLWILDSNGNGKFDVTDRQFTFGQAGDIPVVGDWDGTGYPKAGIFRNGLWILDLSGHMSGVATGKQDLTFAYGTTGDIPVVGDWGNTGVTKIGVFRNATGTWYLDSFNNHSYVSGDQTFVYGSPGQTPLVGDWDGSGVPKFGTINGPTWALNIEGTQVYRSGIDTQFSYGNSSMQCLVGH